MSFFAGVTVGLFCFISCVFYICAGIYIEEQKRENANFALLCGFAMQLAGILLAIKLL